MSDNFEKHLSDLHEQEVAEWLEGLVVIGSGATFMHKGDVKNQKYLAECKRQGCPGGKAAKSTLVKRMEKITDQAWSHNLTPILANRFYMPDSLLANNEGWVDLFTVRMWDWLSK